MGFGTVSGRVEPTDAFVCGARTGQRRATLVDGEVCI